MAIIPTVRCQNMRRSLAFYVNVLGFERVGGDDHSDDPSFSVLSRGGHRLFLSSHRGDGAYGQAIVVETADLDSEWRQLLQRGHRPAGDPNSPVHEGPIEQTWGAREFYIADPDGNTLRFMQG